MPNIIPGADDSYPVRQFLVVGRLPLGTRSAIDVFGQSGGQRAARICNNYIVDNLLRGKFTFAITWPSRLGNVTLTLCLCLSYLLRPGLCFCPAWVSICLCLCPVFVSVSVSCCLISVPSLSYSLRLGLCLCLCPFYVPLCFCLCLRLCFCHEFLDTALISTLRIWITRLCQLYVSVEMMVYVFRVGLV